MQNSRNGLDARRVAFDTSFRGSESMAGKRHRLVSIRKEAGFSQERLAEALGVERTTVMRWERGETTPQPWARPKLARALGISDQALSELLGESTDFHTRPCAGSGMPEEPVGETGCVPVLSASWNQQGAVTASVALKGGSPVNRRRFTLLTGAALTVPAHQWLVRDPEPLASGLSGGRCQQR
jgi:DNA-binding XRE family transcriptional regulator